MHLIGCTFYGIFASGELQPWAEPPPEEQQVWAPPAGAITNDDPSQAGMMGAYMKETSFVSNPSLPLSGVISISGKRCYLSLSFNLQGAPEYNEQSQMQQSNAISYGATGHVANNPFAMAGSAPFAVDTPPPSYGDVTSTGYVDYTQPQPQTEVQPSTTNPYLQQAYQQQQ